MNRPLLEFLQVFGDELHAVHERRDLVVGLCPEPDVDPLVLVDPRGAQHGPGGQPEATTSIEVVRGIKRALDRPLGIGEELRQDRVDLLVGVLPKDHVHMTEVGDAEKSHRRLGVHGTVLEDRVETDRRAFGGLRIEDHAFLTVKEEGRYLPMGTNVVLGEVGVHTITVGQALV